MRTWKVKALILCLSIVGVCCFNSLTFAQAKPISLNYSTHMPAQHSMTLLANEWGKEIEKRTNGRVKVTVFAGGTLLAADKCYDGVVKGIADIGLAVPGFTRGRFPLSEVIDLPFGYENAAIATKMANVYFNRFKPKEFDETQVMYLHAHGPAVLNSKERVNKFEDFKGLKIRCTGLSAKMVAAIGAVPVAMPVSDTYDALSRGVVDAAVAPAEALEGWRWAEVVKYVIESPGFGYTTAFVVVMNKKTWNALPPDIKTVIEKINKEWIEKEARNWDSIDKGGIDLALKLGVKITSLPKAETEKIIKANQPLFDDYVNNMKKNNLSGDEVLKFYREQLKKLQ